MGAPQVVDIGTKIRFNVQEDISGATVLKLLDKRPDGTTGDWTAAVYNSTYAEYTTLTSSDLNKAGQWELQVYIESPS